MASGIKFFLTVLLIIEIAPNLFSQDQPAVVNPADTVKTVAIYSSNKTFFEDYPVTSLVSFLNSLNTNRKIRYYRSTGDSSKTGMHADYIIDLDALIQMPKQVITSNLEEKAYKLEVVEDKSKPDGTAYGPMIQPAVTNSTPLQLSTIQGVVHIKIIENDKSKIVEKGSLTATNEKSQDLKVVLIIKLVDYILDRFSK